MFFAIVAGRDGHDFVPAAIAGGAAGVVVQRPVDVPAGADPVIVEVADTLLALQDLARAVRRASGARVVAITGSAGKTTTKDAIAAVLGARYRVVKNRGNLNNHLGLPISLVELRTAPDVAVMELGMNHAGEIRVLVDIAQPDVRVWTNVGDAHIGYFGSRDAIADAKAEILEQAGPGDAAGLQRRRPAGDGAGGGVPRPGRDVRPGDGRRRAGHRRRRSRRRRHATPTSPPRPVGMRLTLRLPGHGHLLNALAATAVGVELRVPLADVAHRLARLTPGDHRGAVLHAPSGATVIDDSLQLQSERAAAIARCADGQPAVRPAHRRARRDAGAGRSGAGAARGIGTRCRRGRHRPPGRDRRRAGGATRRGGDRRRTAGGGGDLRADQRRRRGAGRAARPGPATSCWSRARAASAPTPWWRG